MPVILAPRLGQEVQECAPHFTVYKELPPLSWAGARPWGRRGPTAGVQSLQPRGTGSRNPCRVQGSRGSQQTAALPVAAFPPTTCQQLRVTGCGQNPHLPTLPTQRHPGKASSQPPSGHSWEPPPTASTPACPPLTAKPKCPSGPGQVPFTRHPSNAHIQPREQAQRG